MGGVVFCHRHRVALAVDILLGGDMQRFRPHMRGFLASEWQQVRPGVTLLIGASHIQSLHVPSDYGDTINLGIGGETVDDVIERLPDYGNLARAASIILCIGTNDALKKRTDGEFAQDLEQLLRKLPPSVPIRLAALPPVARQLPNYDNIMPRIARFNHILKVNCTRSNCFYVPFPAEMIDSDDSLKEVADRGDHLHLSAIANELWVKSLLSADSGSK